MIERRLDEGWCDKECTREFTWDDIYEVTSVKAQFVQN
jgi:hypothetical protein